jgi:hypothetical protein
VLWRQRRLMQHVPAQQGEDERAAARHAPQRLRIVLGDPSPRLSHEARGRPIRRNDYRRLDNRRAQEDLLSNPDRRSSMPTKTSSSGICECRVVADLGREHQVVGALPEAAAFAGWRVPRPAATARASPAPASWRCPAASPAPDQRAPTASRSPAA